MNLFLKEKPLRKLLFALTVSALLPVGAHAFCYGVPEPISPTFDYGTVCGTLEKIGFNGTYFFNKDASQSYVKICPAGQPSDSGLCNTTSTGSYDDGSGTGHSVQAYAFLQYRFGATNSAPFDLYAWGASSFDYWGSSSRPIRRVFLTGGAEVPLSMPPRPLDPTPIYPSGNTVGSSYTVTWRSGTDLDRSMYPVAYAVWYKYWPFGGTEPASWTLSRANMPCQDNGGGPIMGRCSTYVAGPQPSGNWAWYVTATLDVSRFAPYPNTLFGTASGGLYFTEPMQ